MPLGDSITGTTCYPQVLSELFIDGGHDNFEFIGTNQNNQSCAGAPVVYTEGHGGYFVTYLVTDSPPQGGKGSRAELVSWATAAPDILLVHMGTNDSWGGSIAAVDILGAHEIVIAEFRGQNPDLVVFVSRIIPNDYPGCSTCRSQIMALNALITEDWATSLSLPTSPVFVVDHFSGFDPATDTGDGCHPNLTGARKMASATYEAVVQKGYF